MGKLSEAMEFVGQEAFEYAHEVFRLEDKLNEITKIANGPVVYKAKPDSEYADALLKLVRILVVLEED